MEYPLPDLLDRYSIVKLKVERIGEPCCIKEFEAIGKELPLYGFDKWREFVDKLYELNGKIWCLESEIRQGKENLLGLEEVGKRAIQIREFNKKRISIKNEIVDLTNSGFRDVKMNHASE